MSDSELMKKYTQIVEGRQGSNQDIAMMRKEEASEVLDEIAQAAEHINNGVELLEQIIKQYFPHTRNYLKAYLLDQIKVVTTDQFATMNPTIPSIMEELDEQMRSGPMGDEETF